MKYKQSLKDPRILVDEMGEPAFQYLGIHLGDVAELVKEVNDLEVAFHNTEKELSKANYEIDELKGEIQDLEDQS